MKRERMHLLVRIWRRKKIFNSKTSLQFCQFLFTQPETVFQIDAQFWWNYELCPFYFLWVWLHGSSHKNNTNENVIHMRNENINKNLFPCYSMICKNFRENIFLEWRFQIRNSCTKTEAMKQCMFLRISKKWL